MVIKRENGRCHFCGKKVSAAYYCYGCDYYICSECEVDDPPMGKHDITDHTLMRRLK